MEWISSKINNTAEGKLHKWNLSGEINDTGKSPLKNKKTPLMSQEKSINHKWTLEKFSRDADIAVLNEKSL